MTAADPAEVARQARLLREFSESVVRRLPVYARVTEGASGDAEVLALLCTTAPPAQRRPVLLLAAVHDVLLAAAEAHPDGPAHPLAAYYPSVSPGPRPEGDPWPLFRDLVLSDPGVAERLATRSTQTNEVARCGAQIPAYGLLAADADVAGRPLALVEIGPSAGLNLLPDRYAYDYEPDGSVGGPSPVTIRVQPRGPRRVPVPASLPAFGSCVGLDREPIDVTDATAARWLVACLWPEQRHRLERLRGALDIARRHPPRLVAGDAVDDLAALVAAVPAGEHPVVLSTWVLSYLAPERQLAFLARLDTAGADRDLDLLVSENPDEVPGLELPGRPPGTGPDDRRFTALVRWRWRDGRRLAPRRLADQHPHANWLHWLGDEAGPADR